MTTRYLNPPENPEHKCRECEECATVFISSAEGTLALCHSCAYGSAERARMAYLPTASMCKQMIINDAWTLNLRETND